MASIWQQQAIDNHTSNLHLGRGYPLGRQDTVNDRQRLKYFGPETSRIACPLKQGFVVNAAEISILQGVRVVGDAQNVPRAPARQLMQRCNGL